MKKIFILTISLLVSLSVFANKQPRTRELFNFDWQFAFGHPSDVEKDFNVGTSYFTYLAKAGYGDGAASQDFDDRSWRTLDLPHDWAAEMGFSPDASHSHGYKTVGPGFPDTNIGWYRKTFFIPEEDDGKRVFIEFDGVFRDSKIWVNGFYCGHEPSGYQSFGFDVSEYLNYGGENVVSVRVDASMEEGWFYEGAGIYRNVWLTKTGTVHVPQFGTYVKTEVGSDNAKIDAKVKVINKSLENKSFIIRNSILDREKKVVAVTDSEVSLKPMITNEYSFDLNLVSPTLWDLDNPYLYEMVTEIIVKGELVDKYSTIFGVRTVEWNPDKGFFLNGKHIKIQGTNNHQNHAGVGSAIPDALYEWRLNQLKFMGNNTYRTSHYPPAPALLEACDRMGMLVLNENRLMGTTDEMLNDLQRLMERDRNHPSVVLWSIGNEEWMIEGSPRGARMAAFMQAYAKNFDDTRGINAAVSGNWNNGISEVIDVMGYNYLRHGNTDHIHAKNPWQASLGTEEGSTNTTRGIYFDDEEKQYLTAYDRNTPSGFVSIQHGWKHYSSRDYLAGMCIWTGFDYRGESTPYTYPSVSSYFGMMDLCGFPKDNVYYLKSWWSNDDVLHILPHWNWEGRENQEIDVWVYSNYDEVELFLNNKSQGRKTMEKNSHLSWMVKYQPGTVKAVAYRNGKKVAEKKISTTGAPARVELKADRNEIKADRQDVSVITVSFQDKKKRHIADANEEVFFTIDGPGRIIGVGNGDPTSLELDKFVETVKAIKVDSWKQNRVADINLEDVVKLDYNTSSWEFGLNNDGVEPDEVAENTAFKGEFILTKEDIEKGTIEWMYQSVGTDQTLYINGVKLGEITDNSQKLAKYDFDKAILKEGKNSLTIVCKPLVKNHTWDEMNVFPGYIKISLPAEQWKRSTFSGLAQVIVQSTGEPGTIVLKATSDVAKENKVEIIAK